jgi:8-oxo-dGTP pyrophosphatase MutT (NUDIX family)
MIQRSFIDTISEAFRSALPGIDSHKKAMPESRRAMLSKFSIEDAKKSAVLLLLYPDQGTWYLPFIKRTVDGTVHSGQIAFPGGKHEDHDSDYIETAKREAEEEIGIRGQDVIVINSLSPLIIPVSNFIVYPVVGYIDYKPKFSMLEEEVAEIHVVDIESLISNSITNKTIQAGNLEIKAPFYEFDDFEVWGATAMILTEFLDVISKTYIKKIKQG